MPTAQGIAITIIKRIEYATFRFTSRISLAENAVERLGTLEAATAEAQKHRKDCHNQDTENSSVAFRLSTVVTLNLFDKYDTIHNKHQ